MRRSSEGFSLRGRLLLFLAVPLLALQLLESVLTYAVALSYSNRVHDDDLADDALSVAQMFEHPELDGALSAQARFLLEYDPDGHNYFSIVSSKHGILSNNGKFAKIPTPQVNRPPVLYGSYVDQVPLRVAAYSMRAPDDANDIITITIGETLNDRRHRARDILLLTIPLQLLLVFCVLWLVWLGVTRSLRVLDPLVSRLSKRRHELEPITGADVPGEIRPLTRTIDELFARLHEAILLQERFISDAAHQLRTPLTGLRLHLDRAHHARDASELRESLGYIRQLTSRAERTSAQLLALSRTQSPLVAADMLTTLDLAELVPEIVSARVIEALHAGLDLGYQAGVTPAWVRGNANALRELLDNLIDNALRYAGRGHSATVSVDVLADGDAELAIEDDGPGVREELLSRLGERFFRVPGTHVDGTGLGLAIVREIALQHGATASFKTNAQSGHGLRVAVRFPPPGASNPA